MRFCADHWSKLKQAVKDEGLWDFVSGDGEQLMDRIVSNNEDDVDPLMFAHMMIVKRALETGGTYMMGRSPEPGSEGHYCPVCEAVKFRNSYRAAHPEEDGTPEYSVADAENYWIKGPVGATRMWMQEKGAVKVS